LVDFGRHQLFGNAPFEHAWDAVHVRRPT
jgi:hypothetical protein